MILDFGSYTKRGVLADLEHPAEIWVGQIADRAGGGAGGVGRARPKRRR